MSATSPLCQLLISRERGKFIKDLRALIDGFDAEQLARWYVPLNARSWPNDCPLKPLEEDPEWAAMEFLSAIEDKVDGDYLTTFWRASGYGTERAVALARTALRPPSPRTFIR